MAQNCRWRRWQTLLLTIRFMRCIDPPGLQYKA